MWFDKKDYDLLLEKGMLKRRRERCFPNDQ